MWKFWASWCRFKFGAPWITASMHSAFTVYLKAGLNRAEARMFAECRESYKNHVVDQRTPIRLVFRETGTGICYIRYDIIYPRTLVVTGDLGCAICTPDGWNAYADRNLRDIWEDGDGIFDIGMVIALRSVYHLLGIQMAMALVEVPLGEPR